MHPRGIGSGFPTDLSGLFGGPQRWAGEGLKTVSTDEKTGMQALARNAPDLPLKEGQVCRQEYDYTRHGTARAAPLILETDTSVLRF